MHTHTHTYFLREPCLSQSHFVDGMLRERESCCLGTLVHPVSDSHHLRKTVVV